MGNKKVEAERRRHSRIPADTEIKLRFSGDSREEGEEFKIGRTIDISPSGVNCRVGKFIPLFTKVEGHLLLPSKKKNNSLAHFTGVVVRSDPEKEAKRVKHYKIAIFFQEINEE